MYTNENNFSFKNVIFQFLFVALFIFILLCLFPTKNYVNDVKSELLAGNTIVSGSDKTSTLVTSAIFNQNITTMKEATILYFTTPRLPEKQGDTVKLTLSEMLEKHLLVTPLDEQGNACDINDSYVEITKDAEEFVLKVNLKCGVEEDYILVHLGCYDYCQGTICESKTTGTGSKVTQTGSKVDPTPQKPEDKKPVQNLSYQYEYKLNGKWSDWSSWSDWSKEAVTGTTSKEVQYEDRTESGKTETIEATRNVTYVCPEGYVQSATDKTKCIKSSETIVTAKITKKYSCPNGFTYSGGMCKKGTRKSMDATRKVTYTCPSGYIILGDSCYKETTRTIDASKTIKYTCDDGYIIDGTSCKRTVTTITRQTFTSEQSGANYKFVSMDTRSACTGCAYITYWTYDVTTTKTVTKAADVDITYACPPGYDPTDATKTKCFKKEESKKPLTTTYGDWTCPSDYKLDGTRCIKDKITTLDPDVTIHYSCEDGYNLIEGRCVKGTTDIKNMISKETYTCPSNEYTLNEQAKTCTRTISGVKVRYYRYRTRTYLPGDTQWRDTNNDQTLLSKGYYLTGNKRVKATN